MLVTLKYADITKEFSNKQTIEIGSDNSDFNVENFLPVKLMYFPQYKNYVLINTTGDKNLLFNGKPFVKVLMTPKADLSYNGISLNLELKQEAVLQPTINSDREAGVMNNNLNTKTVITSKTSLKDDFDNDVEKKRIAIIKEIGFRILELKGNIKSGGITSFCLNVAMIILSVVSSFGITNFLLGLKIDNTSSVLNLTTNVGFLVCVTIIVGAICLILKQGIYSLLDVNQSKRLGDSAMAQKGIIAVAGLFLFVVYVMNLFYYKSIPGFLAASLFISLLFVGALTAVTIGGGYFKYQIKVWKQQLTNCEYREDFENVMKSYRKMIATSVNQLSPNRINSVKSNLVNNQLKSVLETFVGILTAPFLAYGVSNTLAGCFPEAANWVRIAGLRFSPIFLVLATFMIIFAFFSFVRAFTIGKQIKASEIIKFDGYHDYNTHGVTILGLDSMHSLEREKNVVMFIACFIVFIEFTMNVSYFISELGGSIEGMFGSFIAALLPTALLIAETHLLSGTMYKIHIYNDLLSELD